MKDAEAVPKSHFKRRRRHGLPNKVCCGSKIGRFDRLPFTSGLLLETDIVRPPLFVGFVP